ncbi:MAG TPA: MFS transporter [Herpetosiphon sp.]|uniref:Major facilitator superfamily MFS_1 n=1 Tax=Herpetosiphon aurantiacus (strain ATCC 23779 / DSM 785 / 114-95) TaxID=316274 RepID=A9B4Q3_HERA2|nr:MFS transporter [Herpetosiphon sp.]ABX04218.1 major facilitator superfamily MFS_1 [Herpetosiphon aurantiacus DSM 785]HBW51369.1 MFS transporter [Herpetosiphon sp.]
MEARCILEHPKKGIRTFLIVWFTQSISVMGSSLTFFTIIIWLTKHQYPDESQKQLLAFALSTLGLARALTTIVLAPIAGAWVDRHDRKQTMIIANIINSLLAFGLMALMLVNSLELWSLMLLQVGLAASGSFHAAAFDTAYSTLVPKRFLPRANGMMQTMWSLSTILAPTVAAALIALPDMLRKSGGSAGWTSVITNLADGTALTIGVDALSFLIVAIILSFLTIPSPQRADLNTTQGKKKSLWLDIKEGFAYIWQRPAFLWLLSAFTIANFVVSTRSIFQPLILKFNLVADWTLHGFSYDTALALLSTSASVGGIIGGIFISSWGGLKTKRVYGVLLPMVVFSLGQILFGLASSIYLTAIAALISSGAIPILNAHSQSIWQAQTPSEIQGRVFAVRRLIAQCTLPLGTMLAGILGGLFNPGMMMALLGVGMGVYCFFQFMNPTLLQIEHDPNNPPEPDPNNPQHGIPQTAK